MTDERPKCEETVRNVAAARGRRPCPNRAKWRVIAPGWTMLMCGTHAAPWVRASHDHGSYHHPPSDVRVEALS